MVGMSVGKERYKLFKKRYYITIGSVTTYYYNEFDFWEEFFTIVTNNNISAYDVKMLGYSIG